MIREKIIQTMKEKSIRAADISAATQIRKSPLSEYLNSKRELRIESIEKILDFLGLEIVEKGLP